MNYLIYLGDKTKRGYGHFKCVCGTVKECHINSVRHNKTRSCGCKQVELARESRYKNGFKLKKSKSSNGYLTVWDKNHNAYEHRLVMKEEIEKFPGKAQVHHIDGNKMNNSKSNLMVVDPKTHRNLENGWKLIQGKWFKTCKKCNLELEVSKENFYLRNDRKFHYICKECAKKLSKNKGRI